MSQPFLFKLEYLDKIRWPEDMLCPNHRVGNSIIGFSIEAIAWSGSIRSDIKRGNNGQKHKKNTFFQRGIARFLRAIRSFRSFSKINGSDSILSIFFKDRRERFDHGRSFKKIQKIERSKIERSKDRIPNSAESNFFFKQSRDAVLPLCKFLFYPKLSKSFKEFSWKKHLMYHASVHRAAYCNSKI